MVAEASAATDTDIGCTRWSRVRTGYFKLLLALTLAVAAGSFIRDRGQILLNVSLWLLLIALAISLWRLRFGLFATAFLLTLTPSLHEQVNALTGVGLHAWANPGVDCCVGFLFAWSITREWSTAKGIFDRFPSGPILLLHAWIAASAMITVGRNLWQSGSELSLRGLAYNVWLIRVLNFQHDYFPLQDLFFYSVATAMLFATLVMAHKVGKDVVRGLAVAVLTGASVNAIFAIWQKSTSKGWVADRLDIGVNAFWPDIHSFGPLMAFAFILGFGLVASRKLTFGGKLAVGLAIPIFAVGLFLSGSRSTFVVLCALIVCFVLWSALRLRGWRRGLSAAGMFVFLIALGWLFRRGHRGVNYETVNQAFQAFDAATLNAMLSYRPEIWRAALGMYWAFPFFGLGQGSFYRLSSIADFSASTLLVNLGGNGAHNYFLQSFVELGPVGLALVLFISVPFVRLGRDNFHLPSFYALLGIAIGNLYAHSLLVREMLMLLAIFAGSYIWEARTLPSYRWQFPGSPFLRNVCFVLGALVAAAMVEVGLSLETTPFHNGERCSEARPLEQDGWTNGALRVPIDPNATVAQLTLVADRPDLRGRTLNVNIAVLDGDGKALTNELITFDRFDQSPRTSTLLLKASVDDRRSLEIRPSHCFIPLNLGAGLDARHLGVRVKELQFLAVAVAGSR